MLHEPSASSPEVPDEESFVETRGGASPGRRSCSPSWVLADQLLAFARRDHRVIDALQMQKLIYLAEGWMNVVHGRSLIREPIEAWEFDPGLPDLQRKLRRFGAGPVQRDLFVHEASKGKSDSIEPPAVEEVTVLEGIWGAYGAISIPQLNSLSCEAGGRWETARRQQPQGRSAAIAGEAVAVGLRDQLTRKAGITLAPGDDCRAAMMEVARMSIHLTEAGVRMYHAERANAMKDAALCRPPETGGATSALAPPDGSESPGLPWH